VNAGKDRLHGTLRANLIVDRKTMRAPGSALRERIAHLRVRHVAVRRIPVLATPPGRCIGSYSGWTSGVEMRYPSCDVSR
jgi:hypothetical protein